MVGAKGVAAGRGDARAGVGDRQHQLAAVGEEGGLDPSRLDACDGGTDRVVDQVAQHGSDVFGGGHLSEQERVVGDDQRDTALAGGDRGRSEERLQERIGHPLDPLDIAAHRPAVRELVEEGARLTSAVGIEQARDHVQAIGELVTLHPQRLGRRTHGLEATGEGLDVGAIPHDHDHPERPGLAYHRAGIEIQHPIADHRLGARPATVEQTAHGVVEAE